MIKITDVSHHIGKQQILHDINLSLPSSQVIALIGPNGAGKSTLFSVMARLQPLQAGQVSFAEHDIIQCNARTLSTTVAMLSQDNHVQGRLRVHELLMFGRYPYHQGRPTANDQQKVLEIIERFELQPLADRFLSALSGGQRQRVLIAMIVCKDGQVKAIGRPVDVITQQTMKELYNVDVTVLNHQGRPVIVDTV